MSKKNREKIYSKHHSLPKHPFWTTLEWSDHKHNITTITDVKHRAIHALFENLMLPEQIITLINLSEKALKPEIRQRLIDTLNSKDIHDPRAWYKDECIK